MQYCHANNVVHRDIKVSLAPPRLLSHVKPDVSPVLFLRHRITVNVCVASPALAGGSSVLWRI